MGATISLTRAERKQAFAGTLKVLRRPKKPDHEAGHKIVLSETRGGRQVVERDERKRQKLLEEGKPITVDIPRQPNLWLTLKGWHLRPGSTEWETAVTVHDFRQPTRMLSAAPSPPSEGGLKTRWGENVDVEGVVTEKKVPARGAQVEHLTAETERGYGGGGRTAVDDVQGVDDATLRQFAERVREENELLRNRKRKMHKGLQLEARLAETRKRGMTNATSKIESELESLKA